MRVVSRALAISLDEERLLAAWRMMGPNALLETIDSCVNIAKKVLSAPVGSVVRPLSTNRVLARLAMRHFSTPRQFDALWTLIAKDALRGDPKCKSLMAIELACAPLGAELAASWRTVVAPGLPAIKVDLTGRKRLRKRPRLRKYHRSRGK